MMIGLPIRVVIAITCFSALNLVPRGWQALWGSNPVIDALLNPIIVIIIIMLLGLLVLFPAFSNPLTGVVAFLVILALACGYTYIFHIAPVATITPLNFFTKLFM